MRYCLTLSISFALLILSACGMGNNTEIVKLYMGGMHCEACVETVEFKFKKEETVQAIETDLETQIVTITTEKDNPLSEETIREIVNWSGYDLYVIERE